MNNKNNVFDQRICSKDCAARNNKYGFCEAMMEYEGRILPEERDDKLVVCYGTLCSLPNKFKIVLNAED